MPRQPHPLRSYIVAALAGITKPVPLKYIVHKITEIAPSLEPTLAKVGYHLRCLIADGEVQQVGKKRGSKYLLVTSSADDVDADTMTLLLDLLEDSVTHSDPNPDPDPESEQLQP